MDAATWGLAGAVLVATIVEMVEALTIVMAMGMTRSWRSTLVGVAAALVVLAVFTAAAGYALTTWLPEAALKLVIGTLLLIFGLQWLRKAVLRSSGRKSLHDEDEIYAREVAEARAAGQTGQGLDWFSFVVSFKGVFLEGVEVVFIVITFGLNAGNMRVAIISAAIGVVAVTVVGILARAPLSRVPENQLKYAVGLLLATFGTYWAVSGLGVIGSGHESIEWPGADLALIALLLAWLAESRVLVRVLRVPVTGRSAPADTSAHTGGP
jgi:Ca2+/H+ antiporter, TMEM165/GDT1 family